MIHRKELWGGGGKRARDEFNHDFGEITILGF